MSTRARFIRLLSVIAALLAPAAGLSQQKPAAPDPGQAAAIQKAVLDVNARMTQAANLLNADAFFEFILDSDQTVIIQNGAVFKSRQEALQAVRQGFAGVKKMDRRFEDPRLVVLSPNAALLTAEGTTSATLPDGRVVEGRFAVSLIFVQKDGQWKLLHGHFSTLPNPRPA